MVFNSIKIRFVFGFLPAVVISSPGGKGPEESFDAITCGIFVHMRDDGDPFQLEALEEHELQHVRQCYMAVGLSGILYNYSTKYRLWAESQAMRKQIAYLDRHYPTREHIKELATHLSTQYFLNISVDEAIQILE